MNMRFFAFSDKLAALGGMLYLGVLLLLPLSLDAARFQHLFSEEGFFEQASILGWLGLAALLLVRIRPLNRRVWAFVVLFLFFAAREADWHKAFTSDSLLKMNYYRHTAAPLLEKVLAGAVALLLISLLLYAAVVVLHFLFRQQGWHTRSGFWLLLGSVLVVLGKLLDRAPAVLAVDYHILLPVLMQHYANALEEGLEALHPLLLGWSFWLSQKDQPRFFGG